MTATKALRAMIRSRDAITEITDEVAVVLDAAVGQMGAHRFSDWTLILVDGDAHHFECQAA